MNTRGGLGGLLDTIFNVLGVRLQPWMAPVVVVVLALLLLPYIYRNQSTAKARRVMTRACSTSSSVERDKLEAEAKTLVAGNPDGLAAIADMALQRGRRTLARALVDELAAIGTRPELVRRLEIALDPDLPATAEDAALRIDRQRGQGLHVAAEDLLVRARRRWPDHSELARLAAEATSPPADGDVDPSITR